MIMILYLRYYAISVTLLHNNVSHISLESILKYIMYSLLIIFLMKSYKMCRILSFKFSKRAAIDKNTYLNLYSTTYSQYYNYVKSGADLKLG